MPLQDPCRKTTMHQTDTKANCVEHRLLELITCLVCVPFQLRTAPPLGQLLTFQLCVTCSKPGRRLSSLCF